MALEKVASGLAFLHTLAAGYTGVPELAISQDGCEEVLSASVDVLALYGVPQLTEKQQVFLALFATLSKVYGPAGQAVAMRKFGFAGPAAPMNQAGAFVSPSADTTQAPIQPWFTDHLGGQTVQ